MRLFIGLKTGCEEYLTELQKELEKAGNANYTKRENLHITLKFLGEVSDSKIKDICKLISRIKMKPFFLNCTGIGAFDGKGIVFAKLGGDVRQMDFLHKQIDDALFDIGFKKDSMPFVPHITLARKFFYRLDANSIKCEQIRFRIENIILFESRQTNALQYVPLFTHNISNAQL